MRLATVVLRGYLANAASCPCRSAARARLRRSRGNTQQPTEAWYSSRNTSANDACRRRRCKAMASAADVGDPFWNVAPAGRQPRVAITGERRNRGAIVASVSCGTDQRIDAIAMRRQAGSAPAQRQAARAAGRRAVRHRLRVHRPSAHARWIRARHHCPPARAARSARPAHNASAALSGAPVSARNRPVRPGSRERNQLPPTSG